MNNLIISRRARVRCCLLIGIMFHVSLNGNSLHAQVDYNNEVRPILAENCFQCHGPDAKKRSGDLRLDLEAEAKKSAIVAGAAAGSELVKRIQSTDPETVMPPPPTGFRKVPSIQITGLFSRLPIHKFF